MNVFGYKRSDKAVKFKIGGVFFIRKVRFIFYFLNFVRQMLIEKQILSDLKKSDRSAFQSLFRYYYPRLKAYAATMVDDSVAEDLVQDLFLYVWEHREDLIMGASFHSYLFQGIYSRCVDYFRKYASYDSCDMEVYEEYLTEQAAFLQNDDEAWEELYAKDFYQQLIGNAPNITATFRRIDDEEIPELFTKSDFLMLPYEDVAQSGPHMIAYNYHLPVIASNIDGFAERVVSGENGFLFKRNDLKDLVDTIVKASQLDAAEYAGIQSNLERYVRENFSIDVIAAQYYHYFQKI